jgi:hypothetical protein
LLDKWATWTVDHACMHACMRLSIYAQAGTGSLVRQTSILVLRQGLPGLHGQIDARRQQPAGSSTVRQLALAARRRHEHAGI